MDNTFMYTLCTLLLYLVCYALVTVRVQTFYQPIAGGLLLILAICCDFFLARKKIRIYVRFFIVAAVYLALKGLISGISSLASPVDTYNFFDKVPYIFNRDTLISLFFILFYFLFDSIKIIRYRMVSYILSTLLLLGLAIYIFQLDTSIYKSFYKNYFNYSLLLLLTLSLFLVRHIYFFQTKIKRQVKKKDLALLALLFFPILVLLFSIVLPEHMEKSGGKSEGLFDSGLFRFDFSNFLQLKDEIKLNDDRVLILELSGGDRHAKKRLSEGWRRQIYLKRYSLEEYTGNGFKIADSYQAPDSPPPFLAGYMWEKKKKPDLQKHIDLKQTLYLININPSSLLGSETMFKVVPYEVWESSRYKQVYSSYSTVFDKDHIYLIGKNPGQENFLSSLSPERKKLLTDWGTGKFGEDEVAELAQEITAGYEEPIKKTLAIQLYLLKNYYYSLRPGLSDDTTQLNYFLFTSKKGYCSYFAFAMTLMLRSVGIASRVAVGFAPDMENRTLNFYDVRSGHGHAWVEVYFDDYGWITFDPTSSTFAPGENYDFFMNNEEEREKLIEEILKNKDKLKEITKQKENTPGFDTFVNHLKNQIRWIALSLILLLCILITAIVALKKIFYYFLYLTSRDTRTKTVRLYTHILSRLYTLGHRMEKKESIEEFAQRLYTREKIDIRELTRMAQEARYKTLHPLDYTPSDLKSRYLILNKNLRDQSFAKKAASFFNLSILFKRFFLLFFISLLFFFGPGLEAREALDDYISDAKFAIASQYFDEALSLLDEAEQEYPGSHRPNYEKGKLYYKYDLFENAVLEFQKAKQKGLISESLYNYLANSYGKIGEDEKAVAVYEEAYENPVLEKSEDLYDNLGWMYYKIHKSDKGIEFIKKGLLEYEDSPDLLMTLGTLYSAKWMYKASKEYYLQCIDTSYGVKSNNFRAIAYYNLALLENSFLYYENALKSAQASIAVKNRSSGHMELSYLYTDAMELKKANNEVVQASKLQPVTLFPQVSQIYIYLQAGKVDKAIELIDSLRSAKDFSWMLYFGTSIDAFYSELYKYLSLAYEYKTNQVSYSEENTLLQTLTRPFRKIFYKAKSIFYGFKFTNLALKIGEKKIKGGMELEGLHQLIDGYYTSWPPKARELLLTAEKIELVRNPRKKRIYDVQKILLNSNPFYALFGGKKQDLILAAEALDMRWENYLRLEAMLEAVRLSVGKEKENRIAALFLTFPQFLPLYNFKIKMNVEITGSDNPGKIKRELKRRLIRPASNSDFLLKINQTETNSYIVFVSHRGTIIRNFSIKADSEKKFGVNFFDKLFKIDLNG